MSLKNQSFKRSDGYLEPKLASGHFFGEAIRKIDIAGLTLFEAQYPSGLKIPKHTHEQSCYCFVLQGSFNSTYGQKNRECRPLSVAFHPYDEPHSEYFNNGPTRLLGISIGKGWMDRMRDYSICLNDSFESHGGLLSDLAMRLYKEACLMDNVSALAIEGITLELLAETARCYRNNLKHAAPHWLNKVRDLLHDRFSESLTINDVAQLVGIHPVHLASAFHRYYQCTFGEYLRQIRVNYAMKEMNDSNRSLIEIATASGFSDQSHLTRTFKRFTGMTPNQYRKLMHAP
jgi:AraC family transcriptional regulator